MGFNFKDPFFDEGPAAAVLLLVCIIIVWATGSAVIIMGGL